MVELRGGWEPTRVLGTLRDMHGSVHRPGVMSCIGKMLDTPFHRFPKKYQIMLKILIASTANLKVHFHGHPRRNNFCPDLMRDLAILGFMWIKATAPSPP